MDDDQPTVTLYARASAVVDPLADPGWTDQPPSPSPTTGRVDGWLGVVIDEDVWDEYAQAQQNLDMARRHVAAAEPRLKDAEARLEQAVAAALPAYDPTQ